MILLNPKSQIPNPKQILISNFRNSKPIFWSFVIIWNLVFGAWNLFGLAQEEVKLPSGELIVKAWGAHGQNDIEATFKYTQQAIDLYKEEANKQQASLKEIPKSRDEIETVRILNDVATAYFIQGESYRNQGKADDAIKAFQVVVDQYPFAQAWDPRGWYWSLAKAAQESIDKLKGVAPTAPKVVEKIPVSQLKTTITLFDSGKEEVVNYSKYGEFQDIGTKDYKYVIKDQAGLIQAVGEGIYPNTSAVRQDPQFQKAMKEGRLKGDHWDFVHSPDLEAAFLKWATSSEPTAVKLYYAALILEKSGLIKQALKAYYAIVVHFPQSYGWTYWHTPWYLGEAAISRIDFLLRQHPEFGYRLADAHIKIINGYDNDINNDIVITNPGRFIKVTFWDKLLAWFRKIFQNKSISKTIGSGKVQLVQFKNGDWQLRVDKKPYVIKGVTYAPTKIGESPDNGTLKNWMEQDLNNNGKVDGPYDAFVDKNKNNLQDVDEPNVGDFQLLKQMGVNTIRLYHQPLEINKALLLDLYQKYGILVILGDFLGKYALGSGATWYEGTDYTNPEHKKKMLESVTKMVMEFKDEPYVLFWLLGNENVYGVACNADRNPTAFFSFVNEVARHIKSIDPNHPVAIASGDTLFLDKFAQYAPDVDIFGANAYRGETFGYYWQQIKDETGKPAFVTEYGCPAYVDGMDLDEAEEVQAEFLRRDWDDIKHNMAFQGGLGNALGGVHFEYLDEWWKAYEPVVHDTHGLWVGPFPGGYMHEEWLGVVGQGDGSLSPFLRQLRKSYDMYQQEWNEKK